jgi:chitin disaccharide deacetylase
VSKRLIVNADDLGLTTAITEGIFACHEAGILTSTSLMVNQPATEYAVERLEEYPKLGVGIHLNLCEGRPVLPARDVPSLVNKSGEFLAPTVMAAKLTKWQVSGDEVEAEFRAQIQVAKALGVELTHADSHHHMHLFFAAVGPFRRALQAEGIQRIRASRIRCWPKLHLGGPHGGTLVRRLAVSAYMELLTAAVLRSFVSPYCRIETYLEANEVNLDAMLRAWCDTFQNVSSEGVFELVCHPALPDPKNQQTDRIHDKRVKELALFTSDEFKEVIQSCGILLTSYAGFSKSHHGPCSNPIQTL